MTKKKIILGKRGMITPTVLVILSVFMVFSTSIMSWALSEKKNVASESGKTKALQIAEAGLSYYKWHLAHNEDDYKNGETWCCVKNEGGTDVYYDELSECDDKCGPYAVEYKDFEGAAIGEYALTITPYPYGSTLMEVESKGKVYAGGEEKTIAAKMGKRSLSSYALLSDTNLWIGKEEAMIGPVHSNSGIRFDNTCSAEVTSAVETYKCRDESCWDMFDCDGGFNFWDFFNEETSSWIWSFFDGLGGDFWNMFNCSGTECETFFSDCTTFNSMFHCTGTDCSIYFKNQDSLKWLDDFDFLFNIGNPCAYLPSWMPCSYPFGLPTSEYLGEAIEMPGIWGLAGATEHDPAICQAYWKMGVPKADFDLFTVDMSNIKTSAKTEGGIYLPPVLLKQNDIDQAKKKGEEVADVPGVGYKIVFKDDGTLDVYVVRAYESSPISNVFYFEGDEWKYDQEKHGSLSSLTDKDTSTPTNLRMPKNGLIFVEDDVWVEGTVRGAATIAASTFSASKNKYARITINGNILYTAKDGRDVLGLMAEGDVLVPQYAPSTLEIDAMMLSQKAHVYTRNVSDPEEILKDSITVYGGIITYLSWNWNYGTQTNLVTEGYRNTTTEYDEHLTYSPPPGFPTEDNYEILSWTERR